MQQQSFDFPGAPRWEGNWEVRDFRGFHQSREGGAGVWRFYVTGFGYPGEGWCSVLRTDGGHETVPIDADRFITILGQRYSPAHWSH